MQTARYALSSKYFTCCKNENGRMMVSEMSDIPNWPAPVFTENKQHFLEIKSERTGEVARFKYIREIRDAEGEFQGVVFATKINKQPVEVHILND